MKDKSKKQQNTNGLHKDIGRLGVLVEDINDNVKIVAEQYGEIKKKLDFHTEMVGKLTIDIAIIKEDVEFIKSSLKKKIDVDEFSALERRVALLERHR